MPFRYVPLLRSKAGEATALANLDAKTKSRAFPIIHLSEKVSETFSMATVQSWKSLPMALDGAFNFDLTGTGTHYTALYQKLGAGGVAIVPSIKVDSPAAYVNLIKPLIGKFSPGIVVKTNLDQLSVLLNWMSKNQFSPIETDLVIDLDNIAGYPPSSFRKYVTDTILNSFPKEKWKSVTLSSASAPKDHGALQYGRNDVPRLCWMLWHDVSSKINFSLDFGDYATVSPDMTEPPGYVMSRATVSVRYTVDDHWIILKGRATTGAQGQPMGVQYRGHAKTLVADKEFNKLPNCWADKRIQEIAQGKTGPGNRPNWVSFAINRHLCYIAHHLP